MAGVDAIELNFSCPQMRIAGMGSDVGQNAEMVAFYTAYVKQAAIYRAGTVAIRR